MKQQNNYTKILFFLLILIFILLTGCDQEEKPTYLVHFETDSDMEIMDMEVKEGEKAVIHATPIKEGYEFIGWSPDITEPIYSETTFVAQYIKKVYHIVYHMTDNAIHSNVDSFTIDDSVNLTEATMDGYSFKGWYSDESYTQRIERIKKGTTEDVDLYAYFEEINYTIIYHLDEGINNFNNPDSYTLSDNTLIYLLPATKEGYTFVGWYKEESFINLVTTIDPKEQVNYNLFARFTNATLATSKVKLDANGGECQVEKNFDYSSSQGTAAITMYNYYDTIHGYSATLSVNKGNAYFYYIALKKVDGFDTIYQIIDIAYPVTNLTATDYDYLIAWHSSLTDTASKTVFASIYNNKEEFLEGYVELLDIPEAKSSACAIECTFYKKDAYEISDYESYTEPTILPTPVKEGYTFKGWMSSLDGSITISYPGYYDSKKITYTAQWIKNEFINTPMEEAINTLNTQMSSLGVITSDIVLPSSLSSCTIKWESSDETIISSSGKVTKPYTTTEITMKATITNMAQNDMTEKITYNLTINGSFHDLTKGIKAGYFYYSTVATDYSYRNLDIMFMAFGVPTEDGSLSNMESLGNTIYKNYVVKAHENGVRVLLSINTKNCATIAASDALIEKFATTCANFVSTYSLDGIDMDWEWPSSSEATNFTKLMKAIYTKVKALNKNYLVSAAVGSSVASRYDLKNSIAYLDFVSIMTYDMQTSSKCSFHNALYYKSSKTYYSISKSVDKYLSYIPASKIVIGIPFYARIWSSSTGLGSKATYDGATSYSKIYNNYVLKGKDFWDEDCQVPYIYDSDTGFFASYDNPKSIGIKAKYVYDQGMLGLMYWQGGQDCDDMLVTALVTSVNKEFQNK